MYKTNLPNDNVTGVQVLDLPRTLQCFFSPSRKKTLCYFIMNIIEDQLYKGMLKSGDIIL